MIYLIIFAIIIFVMFALNPELVLLVVMLVVSLPIAAYCNSKQSQNRNERYKAKHGRTMQLMTVYGNDTKHHITRLSDGTISDETHFFVKESQVISHSYKPAETVYRGVNVGGAQIGTATHTPGGVVSKNHNTRRGYIEASRHRENYKVDRVVLSDEIQKIYASDPLYQKYAINGTILCNNGKEFTDAELNTHSKLSFYEQMEYATILVDKKCLSYEECKEIATLLNRIQDGMNPEEMRLQKKKSAGIFLSLLLLIGGIIFALVPYSLEDTIVRDLGRNQTYMNLNPEFYNGESVSLTIDTFEVDYDEYRPKFNFYIPSKYSDHTEYMDIKTLTWTKMKLISYEYDYDSPFSGPFILKYKWNDGQFIATKLLDSEGNVLWTRKAVAK